MTIHLWFHKIEYHKTTKQQNYPKQQNNKTIQNSESGTGTLVTFKIAYTLDGAAALTTSNSTKLLKVISTAKIEILLTVYIRN